MNAKDIADRIAELAGQVVNCATLDARDKNTLIGQLRNAAAFAKGAEGLAPFQQAPFAPTTR